VEDTSMRGTWFARTTPVRFALFLLPWSALGVGVALAAGVLAADGGRVAWLAGGASSALGLAFGLLQYRSERRKLAEGTWGRPRDVELGCAGCVVTLVLGFALGVGPRPVAAAVLGLVAGFLVTLPPHLVLLRRAYRRARATS
jgi:hypothetical protein